MEDPSDDRVLEILNESFKRNSNPSVAKLSGGDGKGKIVHFDRSKGLVTMVFRVDDSFCNGKVGTAAQVQGGFAAAMLDSVCANAVVCFTKLKQTVATLEQKCTFLQPVPPNSDLYATAKLLHLGKRIAFLEAELRTNETNGKLLVKASQSCALHNIVRKKSKKDSKL